MNFNPLLAKSGSQESASKCSQSFDSCITYSVMHRGAVFFYFNMFRQLLSQEIREGSIWCVIM